MAALTKNYDIASFAWTAISTAEQTVLVQLVGGRDVEIAVAGASGDLAALAPGHTLKAAGAAAIPFYGCTGQVFARLAAKYGSDASVAGRLTVTAY